MSKIAFELYNRAYARKQEVAATARMVLENRELHGFAPPIRLNDDDVAALKIVLQHGGRRVHLEADVHHFEHCINHGAHYVLFTARNCQKFYVTRDLMFVASPPLNS